MRKSCDEINKMLVNYADGELSASESRMVAEHLAKCERCRSTLKALERSLNLAGLIWQDGLAEISTIGLLKVRPASRLRWRRYVAIAACILFVLACSIVLRTLTISVETEPTLAEIERKVSESASAARSLAVADMLAKYPGAETFVMRQYRHIVDAYPQTAAAAEAKLRIK